jgi:hypothetical protein
MRASWSSRRGLGAIVAFVIWVIAITLIYAMSQSQAQSGALSGVIRAAGLRVMQWAGRSALNEVAFKVRRPASGDPAVMRAFQSGTAPSPMDPVGTRELYRPMVDRGELVIHPVDSRLVSRPAEPLSTGPWQFDFSVKVEYKLAGVKLTRQLRRRHLGRQYFTHILLGPRKGEKVPTAVSMEPDFLFEVLE